MSIIYREFLNEQEAKKQQLTGSPKLPVDKIVVPRIFHFEDALGNKHEIGEAKCFIDHRGIIIFYAEKSLPGEKPNPLLKPILEA